MYILLAICCIYYSLQLLLIGFFFFKESMILYIHIKSCSQFLLFLYPTCWLGGEEHYLQLPIQSVPITTKVMRSNPVHCFVSPVLPVSLDCPFFSLPLQCSLTVICRHADYHFYFHWRSDALFSCSLSFIYFIV
jgi:hypothetical protein